MTSGGLTLSIKVSLITDQTVGGWSVVAGGWGREDKHRNLGNKFKSISKAFLFPVFREVDRISLVLMGRVRLYTQ